MHGVIGSEAANSEIDGSSMPRNLLSYFRIFFRPSPRVTVKLGLHHMHIGVWIMILRSL